MRAKAKRSHSTANSGSAAISAASSSSCVLTSFGQLLGMSGIAVMIGQGLSSFKRARVSNGPGLGPCRQGREVRVSVYAEHNVERAATSVESAPVAIAAPRTQLPEASGGLSLQRLHVRRRKALPERAQLVNDVEDRLLLLWTSPPSRTRPRRLGRK